MDIREISKDELPVAARIFETALGGEDLGDIGRGAWLGYIEMSHTLGAFAGERLVGTATQYAAELTMQGGATAAVQAVTGVGVLPTHTRRGLARGLMRAQFVEAARAGAVALVLEASEATIYGRFGYGPASVHVNAALQTQHMRMRDGLVDRGSFEFAEGEAIAHYAQPLYEAWRRTRPGQMSRPAQLWGMTLVDVPAWRNGGGELQWVFHVDSAGTPDGYVAYRTKMRWDGSLSAAEANILEIVSPDPHVRALLLGFVADIDLVEFVTINGLSPDDALHHRLVDPRRLRTPDTRDGLWVRIIDVPGALAARHWWAEDSLVLHVVDDDVEAVAGNWRCRVLDGQAEVQRTADRPDLTLGVAELSMLWLGGVSAISLGEAGRIKGSPDALARATLLFRGPVAPQHVGEF